MCDRETREEAHEEDVSFLRQALFISKEPSDPECYLNACINIARGWYGWGLYAAGYKNGADILVQWVMENNQLQDELVYPIVFLYRHFLELSIKKLLLESSLLLNQGVDEHMFNKHDLAQLWGAVAPNLRKLFPDDQSHECLSAIGDRLQEFSNWDKRSDAFRYSLDKEERPTLDGLVHINLTHLRRIINSMSEFLDSSGDVVHQDLEEKLAWESDSTWE